MAENISSQGELDEAKEALLTDCVVKAATCPLVQAIIEDIPALSPGMIESSWFKLDEERPIAINKLLHTLDNVPHKFEDAVFGGFGDAVSESERLLNILGKLERTFSSRIIGQAELVRMVLVAMVLNEHALLEGLPGVGKMEIVKWIAQVSGLPFSRSVGVAVKQSPRKRARAPFVRIARIRLRRSMTVLGPLVRRAAAFAWAKLRQQSHKMWFMTVAVLLLLFLSDH